MATKKNNRKELRKMNIIRDEFILAILDDMEKHMANAKTKGEKALVLGMTLLMYDSLDFGGDE